MRAALITEGVVSNVVIAETIYDIPGQLLVDIDLLPAVDIGWIYNGSTFSPPPPPVIPPYPPDTPQQHYLEFLAMMNRRVDALEASGDIVGALLLKESLQ